MTQAHRVRATALLLAGLVAASPLGARAQEGDDTPPVIGFSPCEAFQRDRPFAVAARFADQSALFEPKLVYKVAGDKTWRHVRFTQDGDLWRATIPRAELTGALDYFVEVFDENGNGPSRVGSPEAPLFARAVRRAPECPLPETIVAPGVVEDHGTTLGAEAAVPAPTKGLLERCDASDTQPFYCKHWVWAAAGGAVLATIGIIIIASSGGGRDYPERVTFVVQPSAETR